MKTALAGTATGQGTAVRRSQPILLLDVMGTLVCEPFRTEIPAFFGMPLEELIREKDPTSWIEFEHGRIDEATYVSTFFRDRRRVDAARLREHLRGCYKWLDGVEVLLSELKAQGIEMHALSNYSNWYRLIEERLEVSRYVAWTFVSARTGLRKPDPEAYVSAARTLGVLPEDCLFVDDRMSNVKAAEKVGMPGICRTDTDKLRHDLIRRGVLSF